MRRIQVLGPGCPRCRQLAARVDRAARELGLEYALERVRRLDEIVRFGVLATPALAVDGEVKAVGRVLSVEEIKELIA